jgi:hypothetical protein
MAEATTSEGGTGTSASVTASVTEPTALTTSLTDDKGPAVKSDDAGTTDSKQADNKDVKEPVIPDKYELKLPDGVIVDPELMDEFTGLAKGLKFDNATAQKAADLHLKAISKFAQQQASAHEAQLMEWHGEIINDPDIGGGKVDATMAQARKTLAMAATIPGVNAKRLTEDLNKSGLTTHPDLVRIFHYLGQFVGEDNKFISGSATGPASKDAATVLYGPEGVKSK